MHCSTILLKPIIISISQLRHCHIHAMERPFIDQLWILCVYLQIQTSRNEPSEKYTISWCTCISNWLNSNLRWKFWGLSVCLWRSSRTLSLTRWILLRDFADRSLPCLLESLTDPVSKIWGYILCIVLLDVENSPKLTLNWNNTSISRVESKNVCFHVNTDLFSKLKSF